MRLDRAARHSRHSRHLRHLRHLRCLLGANRSLVSELVQRLAGTGLQPEQVLAVAQRRGLPPGSVVDLVVPIGSSRDVAVVRLRGAAAAHARAAPSPATVEPLPHGVRRAPPERATDFDLTQVPLEKIVEAVTGAESNAYPVSDPTDERPADPLFATWFNTFEALGTREVTMAEMCGLIVSEGRWPFTARGLRDAASFRLYYRPDTHLQHAHDLHKFTVGFRGPIGDNGWSRTVGNGGEFGLFARATDPSNGLAVEQWSNEDAIHAYWGKYIARLATARTYDSRFDPGPRTSLVKWLCTHSREQLVITLSLEQSGGLFADPNLHATLRPIIDALLNSAPGSAQRIEAAHAYKKFADDRQLPYQRVSVSGATAEVQMLQTIGRYLVDNKIDTDNPTHTLDVVAVYRLYRRLLESGQLATRATVETWLVAWGVPHQP